MSLNLEQLATIRKEVETALQSGRERALLYAEYLGRKGKFTLLLKELGKVAPEERGKVGAAANSLKQELEKLLATGEEATQRETTFDPTVPALPLPLGSLHPISAMIKEMVEIFQELSFEVVEGPEMVHEEENFEMLNLGKDHPARDSQDSFYVHDDLLLRTHTTAIQVLEMQKRHKEKQLPIRIVMPGKTYRRESDQTHAPMFHQIDAVMVDTQTTFADLRGCLDYFTKRLFGDNVETRFRPHHFPFTEPSAELDIRFKGSSALAGKHTGWLEMGGCGRIHPKVLQNAGINPRIYQGWAFGMSIERPLMIRHQIPDVRLLTNNSSDFLHQFSSLS